MNVTEHMNILNMDKTFQEEMKKDVLAGFNAHQKSIPSKYFYDARGSSLFCAICRLPEYYQTRTELSIIENHAAVIMEDFGSGDIIELGSGENLKIRALLDAGKPSLADIRYIPVDVSESSLIESAAELTSRYPDLKVSAVVADFTRQLRHIGTQRKKLFLFFGSTIGNFPDDERSGFMRNIAGLMGPEDRFVLGIDMIKPSAILEAAYNDSEGITAEFNLNILRVLNRELGANFDTDRFSHLAFYDAQKEQVEMHLRADRDLVAEIPGIGRSFRLRSGETVHTEICGKFSRASAKAMADDAGLAIESWFCDPQEWFALAVMAVKDR